MKKIVPLLLSMIGLAILQLGDFHNPIYFLTNDFYIEKYQRTNENYKQNDKIVIVNISDLSDENIRGQVDVLAQYEPAVIGIDYFMSESLSTSEKIDFKNIVLPIVAKGKDSILISVNNFTKSAHYGSTKIYSPLYFEPFIKIQEKTIPFIATEIIQLYDSLLYTKIVDRGNPKEVINYLGNIDHFPFLGDLATISTQEELHALESIKDKIVLVGYAGINSQVPTESDSLDAHWTPKGKMFGVVVMANILHTLMENYVDQMPFIGMTIIILLISVLNIYYANALSSLRFRYWIIKSIQLMTILTLLVITLVVIHQFNIALDYEQMIFSVIICPEITFWYNKLFAKAA